MLTIPERLERAFRGVRWLLWGSGLVASILIFAAAEIIQPALRTARLEAEVTRSDSLMVQNRVATLRAVDSIAGVGARERERLRQVDSSGRAQIGERITGIEENVAVLLALSCANASPHDLEVARAPCRRAASRTGIPTR